jgi:DNA polymerase-4
MFIDLNAYFASVEQQLDPALRGKPLIVAPSGYETGTAVAASYEAKKFGIKTGTLVGEARRLCPEVIVKDPTFKAYTVFHKRVVDVVGKILPIDKVCSIDEMRFSLLLSESHPETVRKIAQQMKQALIEEVGECITASIGAAPNHFLSKLATDMEKPDGLVIIEAKDLPHKLFTNKLTDFCGINKRTQIRLNAAGIFSAKDLTTASRDELFRAFGGIVGERFWFNLQGVQVDELPTKTQSLGHSHVLPPERRNEEGCRMVLLRLLEKATARLRADGHWATHISIYIKGRENWEAGLRLPASQDLLTVTEAFRELWERRKILNPIQVGVTFTGLLKQDQVTPSLFDSTLDRTAFSHAMDKVNQRFGKHKIYQGAISQARSSAAERIAFQKVELFKEGAGDHDVNVTWTSPFQSPVIHEQS